MALCAVGILSSVYFLFSDRREYILGDAAYQQLRILLELSEPNTDQAFAQLQTVAETSSDMNQEEKHNGFDFTSLERINPDVVGWLASIDREIDYPVVKGNDNTYYLSHMFTGERNRIGSIFLDYRNHIDFSDKNTIVFGHNMKDGSMFSSITNYKDQKYYDRFPTMLLYTPNGEFMIEIFAGIVIDGDHESVPILFKDDYEFNRYIDSIKKLSTFESYTSVNPDDKIITLITCSYEFSSARYALYGKLSLVANK